MVELKRIMKACLEQTIKFEMNEEYRKYIAELDKKKTKYKIINENKQADGSVIIEIKKQYNTYPCEDYLA